MINLQPIRGTMPDKACDELFDTAVRFQLVNPLRMAHFLAQVAHESINFSAKEENLNYSGVALLRVFGKYFTPELATRYARQPEKIANRVYADRMGNGDRASGDGWKYRGRGYIQLTGKDNYKAFNSEVSEDVVDVPDFVATKYPMFSAGWFWNSRNLNGLADLGATDLVITSVTRKVNGGITGLEDRKNKFYYYYNLLKNG